jgi:hypothetical protein
VASRLSRGHCWGWGCSLVLPNNYGLQQHHDAIGLVSQVIAGEFDIFDDESIVVMANAGGKRLVNKTLCECCHLDYVIDLFGLAVAKHFQLY